jgi:hypothetical protein
VSDVHSPAAESGTPHLADALDSFLLVRHPPVLARLCQEISVVMSDEGELSRVHIQRLHYLKCVLNESKTPLFNISSNH